MELPEAYYLPLGDGEFESTAATTSPWDASMQHGGPPAALLAHTINAAREEDDMPIARLTIDMLGPIPQGRMRVEAHVIRPGKRIEMIEASLWAGEKLAVSATAWRIRRNPGLTAEHANEPSPPPIPDEQEQRYFSAVDPDWGYGRATEWRYVQGSLTDPGPASVWTRVRIPLIAGTPITPTERLAIVADAANGLSGEVPFDTWTFIPPTMTMTLGREPVGEWMHMDVRSTIAEAGTGVAYGELSDEGGLMGTVAQPILVFPQAKRP